MAVFARLIWVFVCLAGAWVIYSWWCLFQNYLIARKVGIPIRLLPIGHGNPFWMLVDKKVLNVLKRLAPWTRRSNFVRYNWRGWEVDDKAESHLEMGDVYMLVTPSGNSLYICNPNALMEIFKRRGDFPRPLQLFEILNVYGPNLSTVEGHQWNKQRKTTAICFNEQNSQLVWRETISQAHAMIRYWASKPSIRSTADDTRTLSLNVLSRAGFGKSFRFHGYEEKNQTVTESSSELATNYKESLQIVLDNCILIMALGTKSLAKPWLPASLKRVHQASVTFQNYMTDLYEEEKSAYYSQSRRRQTNDSGNGQVFGDSNLMTALVKASALADDSSGSAEDGGLTEREIYGNMFVFNFAGHDTTAHTLTFVFAFLAANPHVQDWLHEEITHVLGDRIDNLEERDNDSRWDYQIDFPRLKRCLAVMMETVRLYTPVPVAKWTDSLPQSLSLNGKTITIPPKTMVLPSYAAIHTHPNYWGPDALTWKPSRWITSPASAPRLDNETIFVPQRGSFIAWSEGDRSCPGKKFSQVEVVATLAVVFRHWKVEPVTQDGESLGDARKRVLHQIETDSAQVLLLQMLHPERMPLVWRKR